MTKQAQGKKQRIDSCNMRKSQKCVVSRDGYKAALHHFPTVVVVTSERWHQVCHLNCITHDFTSF
jgi:hypothetical protein